MYNNTIIWFFCKEKIDYKFIFGEIFVVKVISLSTFIFLFSWNNNNALVIYNVMHETENTLKMKFLNQALK